MSQFASFADFLASLLSMFVNFLTAIPTVLLSGIDFIVYVLIRIPSLITNNMFANLPFAFKYGLQGALGVVILVTVLKIWALIRG